MKPPAWMRLSRSQERRLRAQGKDPAKYGRHPETNDLVRLEQRPLGERPAPPPPVFVKKWGWF